jgi:regulator of replication initiation timing
VNEEIVRQNGQLQRQTTQFQFTLKELMEENLQLQIHINQLKNRITELKQSEQILKVKPGI